MIYKSIHTSIFIMAIQGRKIRFLIFSILFCFCLNGYNKTTNLQIYAGSFFAIPLIRWVFVRTRNAEIEKRNQTREQCARVLELPDLSLRRKVAILMLILHCSFRFMVDSTYCLKACDCHWVV